MSLFLIMALSLVIIYLYQPWNYWSTNKTDLFRDDSNYYLFSSVARRGQKTLLTFLLQ